MALSIAKTSKDKKHGQKLYKSFLQRWDSKNTSKDNKKHKKMFLSLLTCAVKMCGQKHYIYINFCCPCRQTRPVTGAP
jgi:hypothetical protein